MILGSFAYSRDAAHYDGKEEERECAEVLSVAAAVESGRGVAVVGEFITAVAGDRVRFVPFVSGAHFQEVGLLYRQSRLGENIRKLVAASLAVKQPT